MCASGSRATVPGETEFRIPRPFERPLRRMLGRNQRSPYASHEIRFRQSTFLRAPTKINFGLFRALSDLKIYGFFFWFSIRYFQGMNKAQAEQYGR
jgi:hypothetical protein